MPRAFRRSWRNIRCESKCRVATFSRSLSLTLTICMGFHQQHLRILMIIAGWLSKRCALFVLDLVLEEGHRTVMVKTVSSVSWSRKTHFVCVFKGWSSSQVGRQCSFHIQTLGIRVGASKQR